MEVKLITTHIFFYSVSISWARALFIYFFIYEHKFSCKWMHYKMSVHSVPNISYSPWFSESCVSLSWPRAALTNYSVDSRLKAAAPVPRCTDSQSCWVLNASTEASGELDGKSQILIHYQSHLKPSLCSGPQTKIRKMCSVVVKERLWLKFEFHWRVPQWLILWYPIRVFGRNSN